MKFRFECFGAVLAFEVLTLFYCFLMIKEDSSNPANPEMRLPSFATKLFTAQRNPSDKGRDIKEHLVFCHVRKAAGTSVFDFIKDLEFFHGYLNRRWWKLEYDACPTKCLSNDTSSKSKTAWVMTMRDPVERQISEFWYSGPGNYFFDKLAAMDSGSRRREIQKMYEKWRIGDFAPGHPDPKMWQGTKCEKKGLLREHGRYIYKTGCYVSNYMIRMILGDESQCQGIAQRYGFYQGPIDDSAYSRALAAALELDRILFASSLEEDLQCLAKDLMVWGLASYEEIQEYFQHSNHTYNQNTRHFKAWQSSETLEKIRLENLWDIKLFEELKKRKQPC